MKNFQIASSTLQEDATAAVQATKRKRSTDARTAAQVSLSFTQSFRREVFNWWSILFECVCQNLYRSQLRSVHRAILQTVLRIDFAGSKTDLDG